MSRWVIDEIAQQARATCANVRGKVIERLADGSWKMAYRGGEVIVGGANGQNFAPETWVDLRRGEGGDLSLGQNSGHPGS